MFRTHLRRMSARQVGIAALWTVPAWLLEAGVVLVAAEALGVELSLVQAVAVTAFTIAAQAFQLTPGNVGVYQASMTGALYAIGIPPDQGLVLSVLTHGLKFAYSYTIAAAFTLTVMPLRLGGLGALRGSADGEKGASRFEIAAARLWNVFNEGKPFTPVFVLGILLLLSLPHTGDAGYWMRAGVALLALVPLFVVYYQVRLPPQAARGAVGLLGPVRRPVPVLRPRGRRAHARALPGLHRDSLGHRLLQAADPARPG